MRERECVCVSVGRRGKERGRESQAYSMPSAEPQSHDPEITTWAKPRVRLDIQPTEPPRGPEKKYILKSHVYKHVEKVKYDL